MVKLGLRICSSRRLSPRARPLIKQVLPTPRSPTSASNSPPCNIEASRLPQVLVSRVERLSTINTTGSSELVSCRAYKLELPISNVAPLRPRFEGQRDVQADG